MGHTYSINHEQYNQLINSYVYIGCTNSQAERLCRQVFNHKIEINADKITSGWEIDFKILDVDLLKAVSKKRVLCNWLKNGWNRIGTWENEENDEGTEEIVYTRKSNECNWPDIDGAAYEYITYRKKVGRPYRMDPFFYQDILKTYKPASDNFVKAGDLPFMLKAEENDENVYISIRGMMDELAISHFVFAVDTTGSMSCRFILVQLSLMAAFMTLPENSDVTLIGFSNACYVQKTVKSGNINEYIDCLLNLSANGGFGDPQILQMSYGILNKLDKKGSVILFTDNDIISGFANRNVRNEYVSEQAVAGYYLSVVGFGSDAYDNGDLRFLSSIGKGRYQLIFEPDNACFLFDNSLTVYEKKYHVEKICVLYGDEELVLTVNTREKENMSIDFPVNKVFVSTAAYKKNKVVNLDNVIFVKMTLIDENKRKFEESIRVKTSTISDGLKRILDKYTL